MTHEDAQLLISDLCGRFPHGLYVRLNDEDMRITEVSISRNNVIFTVVGATKTYVGVDGERIRPYLRSMSTMTDDERYDYSITLDSFSNGLGVNVSYPSTSSFDWLNKHHFDFRGLIEKGLAYEAPDWMYI